MAVKSVPQDPAIVERFWSWVEKTSGCWIWKGSTPRDGYGQFVFRDENGRSRRVQAHRFSWMLDRGKGIKSHKFVLHHCDNPSCVNPEHLFLGTQKDNMQDCIRKGRFPSNQGSSNGFARLTEEQVKAARNTYKSGKLNQREIAEIMGVSPVTVNHIMTRRLWAHVD